AAAGALALLYVLRGLRGAPWALLVLVPFVVAVAVPGQVSWARIRSAGLKPVLAACGIALALGGPLILDAKTNVAEPRSKAAYFQERASSKGAGVSGFLHTSIPTTVEHTSPTTGEDTSTPPSAP